MKLKYQIGTMIELPRAALCADDLASSADFFSFGTNDLTQTALGISRDDIGSFLHQYLDKGIFPNDPFISIDKDGVGKLLEIGIEKGKKTNLDLLTLIGENFLTYNCSNCGHSVRNHIWQCPSCNHWETFKPNTISDRVAIND